MLNVLLLSNEFLSPRMLRRRNFAQNSLVRLIPVFVCNSYLPGMELPENEIQVHGQGACDGCTTWDIVLHITHWNGTKLYQNVSKFSQGHTLNPIPLEGHAPCPNPDMATGLEILHKIIAILIFFSFSCFSFCYISGSYTWSHSKQPVAISRWLGAEPDGGTSQNCAGIFDKRIIDMFCNSEIGFICELYN